MRGEGGGGGKTARRDEGPDRGGRKRAEAKQRARTRAEGGGRRGAKRRDAGEVSAIDRVVISQLVLPPRSLDEAIFLVLSPPRISLPPPSLLSLSHRHAACTTPPA